MLKFIDNSEDTAIKEAIVIITIVPKDTDALSLRGNFHKSFLVVTRLEPNGACISVAINGLLMYKRCEEMVSIVESISSQLG